MADVIQQKLASINPFSGGSGAGLALPNISPIQGLLIGMILLVCLVVFISLYKFFVYNIKILELEDRGRGSLVARVLVAKKIMKNGTPRYKLWMKKDSGGNSVQIMASSTDNIIPLKLPFMNMFRDIVIMHKDKIGDYRPWKVYTNKDQINIDDYTRENPATGNKMFSINKFLDNFFPNLKIDNLKMRGWYVLNTKETFNLYQDPKEATRKKVINMMLALFVIFAVGIGAYLFLG